MQFENKKRYRMQAVAGEVAIKVNPETGTRYVEIMCEVTRGDLQAERVRYRGYVNTPSNAERAANDLRLMGWRGLKWGDWNGLGSREFQGTVMIDMGDNGKQYPRVAFVNEVPSISDKNTVDAGAIDELNRTFAPPPPAPRANGAPAPSTNGRAAPNGPGDVGNYGAAPSGSEEIPF